jgi:hypothetical protein
MQVTTIGGTSLDVDTSNNACAEFGFSHGQRIATPTGCPGRVIGVAPKPIGENSSDKNVLFVAFDSDNGRVCFYLTPTLDLRKI